MKTRLIIAILAVVTLFCSCRRICAGCGYDCPDVVRPSDLKPIDWDGWNDAYTVCHTFHGKGKPMEFFGDTIQCYGCISKYIYNDSLPLSGNTSVTFECVDDSYAVMIHLDAIMNSSDKDSLVNLLNGSNYSDTCYVKGILGVAIYEPVCVYFKPSISVGSIGDIHFKKSQP